MRWRRRAKHDWVLQENTMSMKQSPYARARRQMRFFILIWTFITLVMGLATFMAIYFTYSSASAADDTGTSVAQSDTGAGAVILASSTPLPVTNTPPPTATPPVAVEVVQVSTLAPTETAAP